MNKTVLITGASRGIGRAAAVLFAQEGYNVVINYFQSEQKALSLAQELTAQHYSAVALHADVTDRTQVQQMTDAALARFGKIDVLVNNCGIAQQKLFTDLTEQDWDTMFNVNMKGTFHCCQCVLPQMIRRHSGKIITVSSMWGQVGASCEVHYSASKAAVIGFTKALAKEVGPAGVQVNCVAPGVIGTEMNAHLDETALRALKEETPLGTIGTPQDIAQAIWFLASDRADFITGQVLSPNGGIVI